MGFDLVKECLDGVLLLQAQRFEDERGFFQETMKRSEFEKWKIKFDFVQDNVSFSKAGVLRGLHFQKGTFAQGKLITILSGKTWTVALDVRPERATFGQWCSFELSSRTGTILYLPPGFAHGFLALEDCLCNYKTTSEYNPTMESGIVWNDPDLKISWPKVPSIVSEKDRNLPSWNRLKIEIL